MQFEFDPAKDAVNQVKHGLPLSDAAKLDWTEAVGRYDSRHEYGEPRLRIYAKLGDRLHMAAVTFRGDVVRVISLRRANRREVKWYEREKAKA